MKWKNNLYKVTVGFYVVLFLTLMTACNNNKGGGGDGGGAAPVNPYVGQPGAIAPSGVPVCQNCPTNAFPILNQVRAASMMSSIQMTFNLFGDQTRLQGMMVSAQDSLAAIYNGPVSIQGQMIFSAQEVNLCNVPAGTYNLTTIQAGGLSAGNIANLGIAAQGNGILLQFLITNTILNSPNGRLTQDNGNVVLSSPGGSAGLQLVSINGQPCGRSISLR